MSWCSLCPGATPQTHAKNSFLNLLPRLHPRKTPSCRTPSRNSRRPFPGVGPRPLLIERCGSRTTPNFLPISFLRCCCDIFTASPFVFIMPGIFPLCLMSPLSLFRRTCFPASTLFFHQAFHAPVKYFSPAFPPLPSQAYSHSWPLAVGYCARYSAFSVF